MKHVVGNTRQGDIHVSLDEHDVIVCVMRGNITGRLVTKSLEQTKAYADKLKAHGRSAYLFIDATQVTGQDSQARSLAKTLHDLGLAKIAIYNRSVPLGIIIQYLIRAGGMAAYAQVFRRKSAAMQWLLYGYRAARRQDFTLRLCVAAIVILLAGGALVGWAHGNHTLTAVFPGLKPLNPVVALLLLLQGISLVIVTQVDRLTRWRIAVVGGIAGISALFGCLVMMHIGLGITVNADSWLFRHALEPGALGGYTPFRTAALLILIASMQFAILSGQRYRWQRAIFHVASILLLGTAFLSIIGYGFGTHDQYNSVFLVPMALQMAISALLIAIALQTVAVQGPLFARGWTMFIKYSQSWAIFLIIVLITGIAWSQSMQNHRQARQNVIYQELQRTQENINSRVNGYVSALRGYRSFFEASDFITPAEYHTYFASSDLSTHYPGFNAISFTRAVPANERQSFTASMRQQASTEFPQLTQFAIYPASTQPVSYPVTYWQPAVAGTTSYGFDLATSEERRAALERARDTGDVAATGTIDLNASRADNSLPARPGFFITIPVYSTVASKRSSIPASTAERRQTIYGFVNAVFEDQKLFADIFNGTRQTGIEYTVSNAKTSDVLYTYSNRNRQPLQRQTYTGTLAVAGQVWQLGLRTTTDFGNSNTGRYAPYVLLAGGFVVALLASALSVTQVHRKERAVTLAADMTEDLHHERDAAVTLRQKDEAILSSIGDAVFAIGTSGTVMLFNRAAENITGIDESEALGRHYKELFRFTREKDGRIADDFIQSALSGKQSTMDAGTMLERADGVRVPVADSAAPIITGEGAVGGVVVVFRDVTREKELDRLKNEFVSMASHELRTPMGAIRAFVSMILAGDYGPVNKNLVEPLTDIRASTMRLVNLVNDLLNVSRIEAGRMKFNLHDMQIEKVVRRAVEDLQPLAKERGISLTATLPKLPAVQIDADKVAQVLTNLLGNALKFTDKGSISVIAAPHKRGVQISVIDTGTGIGKEDQAKLFGKFEQVTSVQEGRPAGTGLGLYISREIIRRMGGELWIETSEVGKGTTFAFTLPQAGTPLARRVHIDRARDEKAHPDAV